MVRGASNGNHQWLCGMVSSFYRTYAWTHTDSYLLGHVRLSTEHMLGHIRLSTEHMLGPQLLFFTCLDRGVHLLVGSISCAASLYEKPNLQGSNYTINMGITDGASNGQCVSVSSLLLVGGHLQVGGHHSATHVHHTSPTTCVDNLCL